MEFVFEVFEKKTEVLLFLKQKLQFLVVLASNLTVELLKLLYLMLLEQILVLAKDRLLVRKESTFFLSLVELYVIPKFDDLVICPLVDGRILFEEGRCEVKGRRVQLF